MVWKSYIEQSPRVVRLGGQKKDIVPHPLRQINSDLRMNYERYGFVSITHNEYLGAEIIFHPEIDMVVFIPNSLTLSTRSQMLSLKATQRIKCILMFADEAGQFLPHIADFVNLELVVLCTARYFLGYGDELNRGKWVRKDPSNVTVRRGPWWSQSSAPAYRTFLLHMCCSIQNKCAEKFQNGVPLVAVASKNNL